MVPSPHQWAPCHPVGLSVWAFLSRRSGQEAGHTQREASPPSCHIPSPAPFPPPDPQFPCSAQDPSSSSCRGVGVLTANGLGPWRAGGTGHQLGGALATSSSHLVEPSLPVLENNRQLGPGVALSSPFRPPVSSSGNQRWGAVKAEASLRSLPARVQRLLGPWPSPVSPVPLPGPDRLLLGKPPIPRGAHSREEGARAKRPCGRSVRDRSSLGRWRAPGLSHSPPAPPPRARQRPAPPHASPACPPCAYCNIALSLSLFDG